MDLKNFTPYKLGRHLVIESLGELNTALATRGFREMGAQERTMHGFVPPMPNYRPGAYALVVGPNDLVWHAEPENYDAEIDPPADAFQDVEYPLIHDGHESLVLRFFTDTKVIVADDLKRRIEARVEEIENAQNRKVYRAERDEIREAILMGILPNAQARRKFTSIAFMPNGLVLVGAVGKAAEDALHALRMVLGTLPIIPIMHRVDLPSEKVLTMVARAQGGDYTIDGFDAMGFAITDDYQVQAAGDLPEIARCKNTDISQESIQEFIRDGKVVTHASLKWFDKVMFKTNTKLQFRSVRPDHGTYEEAQEEEVDLATAGFSEAIIELSVLQDMLEHYIALHGGLFVPAEEQNKTPQLLRGFWDNLHSSDA